jgi:hypothetical protein
LFRSPNIAKAIKPRGLRWAGYVGRMEKGRSAFKMLTSRRAERRLLGRSRHR